MATFTRPQPSVDTDAQPADSPPTGPAQEVAVETRSLGKRFGDKWAVRNLSFRVQSGTILGLLGPSGSGKTTTIRLILGLLSPDEGELRVLGTSPRQFTGRTRSRIGYMPQLFVLYPELSVGQNLSLAASLYGIGWLKRRKAMRQVLDFVELSEHRRELTSNLSGGMQRRLQLASALVHDPDFIVVDEPTAGVDPILRSKFWERFGHLRDEGRTIVVTSQYVAEAEYCDGVALLGQGQLAAFGTPESLRKEAFGGEVVDVVADGLYGDVVRVLAGLEGVREVRGVSYEQLQLTVDEASVAIPRVLTALEGSGATVRQIEQHRPSFDQVFVRLIEQQDIETVE